MWLIRQAMFFDSLKPDNCPFIHIQDFHFKLHLSVTHFHCVQRIYQYFRRGYIRQAYEFTHVFTCYLIGLSDISLNKNECVAPVRIVCQTLIFC